MRPQTLAASVRRHVAIVSPSSTYAFPWLLRRKVTIPDRVAGYLRRPELEQRVRPTRRKLTVLKAAGGFGKTTLLAECCRRLRERRIATAWLSLDEDDDPGVLDVYVAFACAAAGLDLSDVSVPEEAADDPASRIGAVVREIESLGRPFVIAFDELERLKAPGSLSLLTFLLQRGPSNLHLAFACRELPDGVDLASPLLSGHAEVVETEDLRFSRAEVARFFDLRLSRRALAKEIERSGGWPIALRVSRNRMERGDQQRQCAGLVGNWIEASLFAGLGHDDRNFVLDLSQLGWIDAALLDEVLQRSDSKRRLESMASRTGLLEPLSDGAIRRWRLHPLVREYCAERRSREDPDRFAAIHRRVATALSNRGETVLAMSHAIEGSDPSLAGSVLEQAGGVRLWIRHGVSHFQQANRLLSDAVVSEVPRLRLFRCLALALAGRAHEARTLYLESRSTRRKNKVTDFNYFVDDLIVRFGLAVFGVFPVGSDSEETLLRDIGRLVKAPLLDPTTRRGCRYALGVLHFLKGECDPALRRLSEATESAEVDNVVLHAELVSGQICLVKGWLRNAESHLERARRIARKNFMTEPEAIQACDVVLREIALECNRPTTAEPPGALKLLRRQGVPLSLLATASHVLIGNRLKAGRIDEALSVADRLLVRLRRTEFTTLARPIVAQRITILVIAGRVAEAEREWHREALPGEPADCVDLRTQSWREVEAVSEARARLLIARRRFDDARSLLSLLRSVSTRQGLRIVEMRAVALSVMLEQQAGESQASQLHLTDYLRLFAESPYAWPLVRDQATCAGVLRAWVDSNPESPNREAAQTLLAMCGEADASAPSFSKRELEILRHLGGRQDKEVASEVGLSTHGVRYHLRSLFSKLDVSSRAEAVRTARDMGLIPGDS
ncbi:MAG: hypothetical protein F4112_00605 [Holophagales bacterium]|nr:hypothetical protein [Holophagales bacterium]MYD22575.1 hypothetical protein [Holophagales bacterium]MYI31445.1 hypothetical protein [Holophagales bacterium]